MAKFTSPKERDTENDHGDAVTQVVSHVFEAPPLPATAPMLPPGFDMKQFADMLGLAIQQGTAGAIEATKPRVVSREDHEYENKSAFNPEGELKRPRPGLRCEMFWGVLSDDDTKPPIPLYEIESAQTTYDEQILLNQVREQRGEMEMNDGTRVPVEVYEQKDRLTKKTQKLVIAFPKVQFEKAQRNQVPGVKKLAKELIERQAQVA
jgi:hypothetical protein